MFLLELLAKKVCSVSFVSQYIKSYITQDIIPKLPKILFLYNFFVRFHMVEFFFGVGVGVGGCGGAFLTNSSCCRVKWLMLNNNSTIACICHLQIDLRNICDAYKAKYGQRLYDAVASETSGDYQQTLLSLIKGEFVSKEC